MRCTLSTVNSDDTVIPVLERIPALRHDCTIVAPLPLIVSACSAVCVSAPDAQFVSVYVVAGPSVIESSTAFAFAMLNASRIEVSPSLASTMSFVVVTVIVTACAAGAVATIETPNTSTATLARTCRLAGRRALRRIPPQKRSKPCINPPSHHRRTLVTCTPCHSAAPDRHHVVSGWLRRRLTTLR